MVAFGIAGARILSVLADGHLQEFVNLCTDPEKVRPGAERDCLEVFKFWHGGLAYYGGFLAAAPAGLWYAARKRLGVLRGADLTSPCIALGLFFGRIGCFLNGCCYGKECELPWAVKFPGHAGRLHPTQLYEAAAALVISTVLYYVVRPRKRIDGQVFGAFLVLYGVARFLIELVRADDRGILLGLSTSQWISIPLVAAGAWLWTRRR